MKLFLSTALVLMTFCSFSQKQVYLHIVPRVSENLLTTGLIVQDLGGIEMSISVFNYYFSNLHLIHDNAQDLDLSSNVYLVKLDNYTLDLGVLDVTNVSQINFGAGVPSDKNHLDISTYPSDNPLSYQTPSMHWGWTAGYTHMIVNGIGDNNNDGVPETEFQLHNLGDANYHNVQLPIVAVQTSSSQIDITINCNLDQWTYGQNPGTVGIVHGSEQINSSVMSNVIERSVFESELVADLASAKQNKGILTFNSSTESVNVSWSELKDAANYTLTDANGKTIQSGIMDPLYGQIKFVDLSSGVYVFTSFSATGDRLNQLKMVQ